MVLNGKSLQEYPVDSIRLYSWKLKILSRLLKRISNGKLHYLCSEWPSWWCNLWDCYLCWLYNFLLLVWSDIWLVATTRVGSSWTWVWLSSHARISQKVACWFQWKGSLFHLAGLSFRMQEFSFIAKLDWSTYIFSTAKTASKKIGAFICSMKFVSSEVIL